MAAAAERIPAQQEEPALCAGGSETVPDWSGRVQFLDEDCTLAMVPLHCSDTRSIHLDGFDHENYYEDIEGDVEYHIYRRRED